MPVNRLKLLAFAFGAGVGGLTGALFAAGSWRLPGRLRPPAADHALRDGDPRRLGQHPGRRRRRDHDQPLARGAEEPDEARVLFFGAIVLGVIALIRPWSGGSRSSSCGHGRLRLRRARSSPNVFWDGVGRRHRLTGRPARRRLVDGWVISPRTRPPRQDRLTSCSSSPSSASRAPRRWRTRALIPDLYLAIFVWENRDGRAAGVCGTS